ncbi:MAG: hypothetical protein ACRD1U_02325, partial [Vicinamibacterales bacterium]
MTKFPHALASLAALGVTMMTLSAQAVPDFSGKWQPADAPANTSAASNMPAGGPPPPPRTLSS